MRYKILLAVDCGVNLILGLLLLLFPIGIVEFLGLPASNTHFYPSILGGVIVGIGFALLLELLGFKRQLRGLGLGGAILINIIGAGVLICWLLFGSLDIPFKGQIILWVIGVSVFSIGIAEIVTRSWIYRQ